MRTKFNEKQLISLSLFLLCLITFAPWVIAQQVALPSISGIVQDTTDAAVAGATITLINAASGEKKQTVSDAQGKYNFAALTPSRYVLIVSAPKFQAAEKSIQLSSNESLSLNFQLAVKAVSESVNIIAKDEIERVPGGVALVQDTNIAQTPANTLKDVLSFTPGVLVQPRFGADESQLSIRGSGLRGNFHLLGVNVLVDGVPYQEPDGFSDFESLDLLATQRVEVWKGANALRYGGNSMGGAINFVTQTGETASPFQVRLMGGSYGFFKGQVSTGGATKHASYYLSFSDTEFDGYRQHSKQSRKRVYGNFGFNFTDQTEAKVSIVYANVSEKLPGSLTLAEFKNNPRQAVPEYVTNEWGRFYDYVRVGVALNHRISERHEIGGSVYGQYRDMDHPIFQIYDQDSRSFGGEVHYRFNGRWGNHGNRFVAGFSPQLGTTGERHYENNGGKRGAVAALFSTEARNYGFYFENQLDVTSTFTFVAGGRTDRAERNFVDRFLADGNRSDKLVFNAFSPKLGFVWRPVEAAQVFANVSRSYEPPLMLELTSFGFVPGFLDLKAQDTWQIELGTRGQWNTRSSWEVTFFNAEINNEIVNINIQPFPGAPFTIPSYRNAKNTRHLGLELGTNFLLKQSAFTNNDRLNWRTAYTLSKFRYVNDSTYANNDLPGAPRHLLRTELRYDHPSGFWLAPNVDWSPASYFVNSANTARNEKYGVLNLRAGYDWKKFGVFLEGVNLTDTRYSASVQVDSDAGRFYEPSNGRSIIGGISIRY